MTLEDFILNEHPLRITRGALETANTYARLAQIDGTPMEAYMYMVGNDYTDDVVLVEEQYVSPSLCEPTPSGASLTYDLIDASGKNILGWCHSHANFDTFFSATDVSNVQHFSSGLKLEYEGNPLEIYYNIVVNKSNDDPHTVIAYRYGGQVQLLEHVPLHVLDEGESIDEEIAKQKLAQALLSFGEESRLAYVGRESEVSEEKKNNVLSLMRALTQASDDVEQEVAEELLESELTFYDFPRQGEEAVEVQGSLGAYGYGEITRSESEPVEQPKTSPVKSTKGNQQNQDKKENSIDHPGSRSYTQLELPLNLEDIAQEAPKKKTSGGSYARAVTNVRKEYAANPSQYSNGFDTVIDALAGTSHHFWVDRVLRTIQHYANKEATPKERAAVKKLIKANKHLRKMYPRLVKMVEKAMEKQHATSKTGSSVGKSKAKAA